MALQKKEGSRDDSGAERSRCLEQKEPHCCDGREAAHTGNANPAAGVLTGSALRFRPYKHLTLGCVSASSVYHKQVHKVQRQ